ncbi:UNVERIFIED_CONTAM: hypothetical protein FKN15_065580 [Acipenser sinensis]
MPTVQDLKTKEEKDAELDKRIEALRKKNEALVRRYQEIEEDKKRAEQEGIAVTTARKPRPSDSESSDHRRTEKENFSITVDLTKPAGEWEEKRRLNIEKMNEEMEKIAEYERGNRSDGQGEKNPGRNFLDDYRRSGPVPDADRKEGSRRHVRNWGGVDFERVKTGGPEWDKEWQGRRAGVPKGPVDMTMTGRERSEYERWKQEREQIDQDRLARHRNATGQWRREWDAQKTDCMYGHGRCCHYIEKKPIYSTVGEIPSDGQGEKNPGRNFLDDYRRSGPVPDADRKEGSRRHVRNGGGVDFERVKTGGPEWDKEWQGRRAGVPKGPVDMTMSMTGRERSEYERWKQEREQIDQDRLARHRNATGQWRREWDAQKTDCMYGHGRCCHYIEKKPIYSTVGEIPVQLQH